MIQNKNKKDANIAIYNDTLKKSEAFNSTPHTKKYTYMDIDRTFKPKDYYLVVINCDTVTALKNLKNEGKTCILNMASRKHQGGGVRKGSVAQEECLYRSSNLGIEDNSHFYPLKESEALYTTNAIFFKDFHYEHMEPINANVVTIAAFNFNKREDVKPVFSDYELETKQKIRLMLSLAIMGGNDNIILGSWGCGVFKNDPTRMATMFRDVLKEGYGGAFKQVIFSIINDHNSDHNNYSIFKSILE